MNAVDRLFAAHLARTFLLVCTIVAVPLGIIVACGPDAVREAPAQPRLSAPDWLFTCIGMPPLTPDQLLRYLSEPLETDDRWLCQHATPELK